MEHGHHQPGVHLEDPLGVPASVALPREAYGEGHRLVDVDPYFRPAAGVFWDAFNSERACLKKGPQFTLTTFQAMS